VIDPRIEQLKAAKRLIAIREAKDNLLPFIKLTMPDPDDPDDVTRSRYEETPVARLLCDVMGKVFRGEEKRVAVSIGPQLGKTEIICRRFLAWLAGKRPTANAILGTFNQPKADEEGDLVRDIIQSDAYRQVFEDHALRKEATNSLITKEGGRFSFVGRGGSGTGRPADFFIVDDPIKDDIEAQSDLTREEVWRWFNRVVFTRCHSGSGVCIVHTRWHGDDLIGRLCDPEHPDRNKKYKGIAERWKYVNVPAVVEDPGLAKALGLSLTVQSDPLVVSMFGTKPMSALWPGRKDLDILAEAKQMDSSGFTSLYMGAPTAEDGEYFKAAGFVEYDAAELPDETEMTLYGASDHAVSTKKSADPTCLGCVGVDKDDDIWVLPDLVWARMATDQTVEELLTQMQAHTPALWWMESDLIAKSFGPFLYKRMREEDVFTVIDDVTVAADKSTRAQSIRGYIAHRRVHFPRYAWWWPDAKKELLQFPNGAHDDFVDFLAHVGLGLQKIYKPSVKKDFTDNVVKVGSIQWILAKTKKRAEKDQRLKALAGW
jgi:predicted phage terminase large subunit-like protein